MKGKFLQQPTTKIMKSILLLMALFATSAYADNKTHSHVKVKNGPFSRGNVTNVTVVQQQATVTTPRAAHVSQIAADPTVSSLAARSAYVRTQPVTPSCVKERPCTREDYVRWYPTSPAPRQYPCPPPRYALQQRPTQAPCPPGSQRTPGFVTRDFIDGGCIRFYEDGQVVEVRPSPSTRNNPGPHPFR